MTKTEFDSHKLRGILGRNKDGDVISKGHDKIRSLLDDVTLRLGKVLEHGVEGGWWYDTMACY